MGRQIGFYTTLKDERVLLKELRAELDCKVLFSHLSGRTGLREVGRLKQLVAGYNEQDHLILVPGELLDRLTIDEIPCHFRINDALSPVIVWSRCFASAKGSYPGRFWYEAIKPGRRKKSQAFLRWAAKVFRRVQRLFPSDPELARLRRVGPDFRACCLAGKLRVHATD